DEGRAVAGLPQEGRVTAGAERGRQRRGAEGELVGPLAAAGEDRGPAGGADGRRHEGVAGAYAARPPPGEVRRLDDGVPGTAEGVEALVVGQNEQDVRPPLLSGQRCSGSEGQDANGEEGAAHGTCSQGVQGSRWR